MSAKSAYVLMPPEVVAGSMVQRLQWSPDGKHLLIVRNALPKPDTVVASIMRGTPPPPSDPGKVEVGVYSLATRKLTVFLSAPLSETIPGETAWLGGVALVLTTRPGSGWRLTGFGTGSGRIQSLASGEESLPTLAVSPNGAAAVLVDAYLQDNKPIHTVRRIYPNATVSEPIRLDATSYPDVVFAQNGAIAISGWTRAQPPAKTRVQWFKVLDFQRGTATDSAPLEPIRVPSPATELAVASHPQSFQIGTTKIQTTAISLVAKDTSKDSPMPEVCVAPDGQEAKLSPDGSAIAYHSQGCAFVRSIIQVPRVVAEEAIRSAQRAVAMSNSKQAALAALMFAADHNDRFPDAGSFVESALPYTKNRSILDSFVYTYPGGLISDIQDPANTEIGYVQGPGGRAVAYADGHVKWIND